MQTALLKRFNFDDGKVAVQIFLFIYFLNIDLQLDTNYILDIRTTFIFVKYAKPSYL